MASGLQKSDLLRRNLRLLGYDGALQLTALNEANVLCALHFLCVQIDPAFDAATRSLFPFTQTTKTTLKKLLQAQLEPHVIAKRLPIGSSNMSRLSAIATQPTRTVDLLWRLSVIALRALLPPTTAPHPPSLNSAQRLHTVQAKIAMKTRQIHAATQRRLLLQAAWKQKARELTKSMHTIAEREARVTAEYTTWKAQVPPGVLTDSGHQERLKTFERIVQHWQEVDQALKTCPVADFASVLQTVELNSRTPPVLQSQHAQGILGALRSTTYAIRALHDKLQSCPEVQVPAATTASLAAAVEQSHLHVLAANALGDDIAALTTAMQPPPLEATAEDDDGDGPLCPPTPMVLYELTAPARPETPPSTTSSDARLHQVTSSIERLSWTQRRDDIDDDEMPAQRALHF
ncbi:hypothetical protein ACHHYP_00797 [Achlya hypogyna]|uniref:HAUS augmin-like complex subunit 6 N-terminal domain-containing protein n=1 Tax=Achlya hypogyna TaxID=1202772 RepID=A0A1V9ZAE0_ACHHY|nr:hypothetical protein ACHHYP_00797 [Achlya hypogyna]